jgi:hypothetical protein
LKIIPAPWTGRRCFFCERHRQLSVLLQFLAAFPHQTPAPVFPAPEAKRQVAKTVPRLSSARAFSAAGAIKCPPFRFSLCVLRLILNCGLPKIRHARMWSGARAGPLARLSTAGFAAPSGERNLAMRHFLRHRWRAALTFIVLLLLAFACLVLFAKRTDITWANAVRIREGMNLKEVEEILGGPPRLEGYVTTDGDCYDWREYTSEGKPDREYGVIVRSWLSDRAAVSVDFNGGRVWTVGIVKHPSLVERLLDWLRDIPYLTRRP